MNVLLFVVPDLLGLPFFFLGSTGSESISSNLRVGREGSSDALSGSADVILELLRLPLPLVAPLTFVVSSVTPFTSASVFDFVGLPLLGDLR